MNRNGTEKYRWRHKALKNTAFICEPKNIQQLWPVPKKYRFSKFKTKAKYSADPCLYICAKFTPGRKIYAVSLTMNWILIVQGSFWSSDWTWLRFVSFVIKVPISFKSPGAKKSSFSPKWLTALYKSEIWKSYYCCMTANMKKFYLLLTWM